MARPQGPDPCRSQDQLSSGIDLRWFQAYRCRQLCFRKRCAADGGLRRCSERTQSAGRRRGHRHRGQRKRSAAGDRNERRAHSGLSVFDLAHFSAEQSTPNSGRRYRRTGKDRKESRRGRAQHRRLYLDGFRQSLRRRLDRRRSCRRRWLAGVARDSDHLASRHRRYGVARKN